MGKSKRDKGPGFGSWFVCSCNTLLVGGGLYFGYLASYGLESKTLWDNFQADLAKNQNIQIVVENEKYRALTNREAKSVLRLVEVFRLCFDGQYERALNSAAELGKRGQVSATLLVKEIDLAVSAERAREGLDKEMSANEQRFNKAEKTYRDTARQLRKLFSLDLSQDISKVQISEFITYQSGVLMGLPLMEELPDGLRSEGALLSTIGVSAAKELNSTMKQRRTTISQELSKLGDAMNLASLEFEDGQLEKVDLLEKKNELVKVEQGHKSEIDRLVRASLNEILKPKLPQRFSLVAKLFE